MVTMREFARTLNGREYDCYMFTKQEIQLAKDNGWIIVTGASDDLMEFEGAMYDEGGCFDAVSYTHLDVYKRQTRTCTVCCITPRTRKS